jgi:hypothetical protein
VQLANADGNALLVNAMSCPTTTYCIVVDEHGDAYQYRAGQWSMGTEVSPVSSYRDLVSISCATPDFCAAGTNGPDIYDDRAGIWTATSVNNRLQEIGGISCPTVSFCVATGGSEVSWVYANGSWSSGPLVNTNLGIYFGVDALSCAAPHWCIGVGGGYAATFSGGEWAPAVQLDPNSNFADDSMEVSCATTTFCLAVGGDGFSSVLKGSTWAPETWVDPYHSLNAVSCASATWCMAVDNAGFAFTYSGGSWSGTRVETGDLMAISCPTTGYCFALDNLGRVYTFSTLASVPIPEYTGSGTGPSWCAPYGGSPLAGFANVYACMLASGAGPKAGATPFDFDTGFQCVELANRFLAAADHGNTIWDSDVTNGSYLYGGNFAATAGSVEGLTTLTPSPGALPAPGDIVSMWGGTSGQLEDGSLSHVAIATSVIQMPGGGWTITTLNENDQSDNLTYQGMNTISVDAKWNWSFEGGWFTSFEWVELPD